jgi:hypothetical protein
MPTKSVCERVSRADLLAEIAGLPPSAFVTTTLAAAYINTSPAVMMNWRSQRRGPRYHGKNEFIRYRISDLDLWMSARADEIPEIENFEASKARVSASAKSEKARGR